MSPVPDHLISCIATISSCILTSSSASSCILPGLSSVLTFQVPIHNLLLLFLCTCFCLHPFNRLIPFLRWEFLACKCFPWTAAGPSHNPQPGGPGDFFSRLSSSSLYRSLCQPQGSGTGFGLPWVFYFPSTLHIWRAFPYLPPGEAPDGRLVTPHGGFILLQFQIWASSLSLLPPPPHDIGL